MQFDAARSLATNFDFVSVTGSTNTDLVASAIAAPSEYPDFSVLATGSQTAGRGRAGRDWVAPPGSSLAVSVLLRPIIKPEQLGWLPLLAGLAMANTIAEFLPNATVTLKWPNDVLVGEHKISGVLSELLPDLSGVVVGAGVNLTQSLNQLPIPTSTSLAIEGASALTSGQELSLVLTAYLSELKRLYVDFVAADCDATASGLRDQIIASCGTIGRQVRAILPGQQEIIGKALTIENTGRLVISTDGQLTAVAAGDIIHLRLAI
jgi:BirA family biotin operon repressor/biotin-[acetyl-CoA-carboxylase] ligase